MMGPAYTHLIVWGNGDRAGQTLLASEPPTLRPDCEEVRVAPRGPKGITVHVILEKEYKSIYPSYL